jgi:hypothetical protein
VCVRSNRETGDGDGDEEGAKRKSREVADVGHLALMKDVEPHGDGHKQETEQRGRRASHKGVKGGPLGQGLRERVVHR